MPPSQSKSATRQNAQHHAAHYPHYRVATYRWHAAPPTKPYYAAQTKCTAQQILNPLQAPTMGSDPLKAFALCSAVELQPGGSLPAAAATRSNMQHAPCTMHREGHAGGKQPWRGLNTNEGSIRGSRETVQSNPWHSSSSAAGKATGPQQG